MDRQSISKQSTTPQRDPAPPNAHNEFEDNRKSLEAGLALAIARVHGHSKTAQLRSWFGVIENARLKGVPSAEIVEELARHGLEIKVRTFEVLMSRLRKRSGGSTNALMSFSSTIPNPAPSKPAFLPASGVKGSSRLTPEKLKQIREDEAGMDQYTC